MAHVKSILGGSWDLVRQGSKYVELYQVWAQKYGSTLGCLELQG